MYTVTSAPQWRHMPSRFDEESDRRVAVRRWPVLRDRSGYVRGYVQYLSFDVPVFFRLLFGPRHDVIVVEPPPTTGFFVRLAARIRRVPYVYYAADVWSDATQQTGAPRWVVRAVRTIERFALRGAAAVLSVSAGVTERLAVLGVNDTVTTVGNGVDVAMFRKALAEPAGGTSEAAPTFLYAGTASEWQGASIFVEALPAVLAERADARLCFIGGGSDREAIKRRARELGIEAAVDFEGVIPPVELAPRLRSATAAVVSIKPGEGYDFAFPTKVFSAAACGTPVIYVGLGPAADFVRREIDGEPLGQAIAFDVDQVATAMLERLADPVSDERRVRTADWAAGVVGIDAVAAKAAAVLADVQAAAGRTNGATG